MLFVHAPQQFVAVGEVTTKGGELAPSSFDPTQVVGEAAPKLTQKTRVYLHVFMQILLLHNTYVVSVNVHTHDYPNIPTRLNGLPRTISNMSTMGRQRYYSISCQPSGRAATSSAAHRSHAHAYIYIHMTHMDIHMDAYACTRTYTCRHRHILSLGQSITQFNCPKIH